MLDGFDVDLVLHPIGAFFGDALLLELVGKLKSIGVDDECLLFRLAGIKPVDERWLTEKETKMIDAVEAVLERVVGVDSEVGGNNRQP